MSLRERISEELLPFVQQPGQYIGHEWNQSVRPGDWERAEVRVALAFPDTYSIGMSHLGCQILYELCNRMPGVCAERVYAPWGDAERIMRQRGLPLFTWDTRRPARDAHVFAVSLNYELGFTNLLLLLDLAGIPLRSEERGEHDPLVIVGGPQADNPEPIADFVDLVVIGDGEHSMAAIVELYRRMRREGAGRTDIIQEMARQFEWIYAPSLYAVDYDVDGTIAAIRPGDRCPAGFTPREHIVRCQTPDFEDACVPLRPLVAHTDVVHDRVSIEIMRGCPQRCRFCHAGYTKRPIRTRGVDRILDIAERSWEATGCEEIGLLSLNTADYPHLRDLAERLNGRFHERRVSLSVPSLRVDKMLSDIPWLVSSVRKSGLTVAVEAASLRLRNAIRKKVTDEDLFEGLKQAYAAGWNSVKLYYMCGFPGEREEDIADIFHLSRELSLAKRAVGGGPASITASVGWLVPKPHTPLQWAAQPRADYFHEARILLRKTSEQFRSAVRIKTHKVERSILEGVLSRGDRRLGCVIEAAYRLGARMDGWDECFRYDLWEKAFEQAGIDPGFYAHRERSATEILPWDHICSGPDRVYLRQQYDDLVAQATQLDPPCCPDDAAEPG